LQLSFFDAFSAGAVEFQMSGYRAQPRLKAEVKGDTLTVIWDGDVGMVMRIRFNVLNENPIIKDISI
jgi:hypothetical protein